jgi:hypothetical protein
MTRWSGSIFEKASIISNDKIATGRAIPGASCVGRKLAATAIAARCLDFGRSGQASKVFWSLMRALRYVVSSPRLNQVARTFGLRRRAGGRISRKNQALRSRRVAASLPGRGAGRSWQSTNTATPKRREFNLSYRAPPNQRTRIRSKIS